LMRAAMATFAFGIPKVGIGWTRTKLNRRFIGRTVRTVGITSASAACENWRWTLLFAISRITRPPLLPSGREWGFQPNLSGKPQAIGLIGASGGNGRTLRICHIPASKKQKARSVSITASLWSTRWSCAVPRQ